SFDKDPRYRMDSSRPRPSARKQTGPSMCMDGSLRSLLGPGRPSPAFVSRQVRPAERLQMARGWRYVARPDQDRHRDPSHAAIRVPAYASWRRRSRSDNALRRVAPDTLIPRTRPSWLGRPPLSGTHACDLGTTRSALPPPDPRIRRPSARLEEHASD